MKKLINLFGLIEAIVFFACMALLLSGAPKPPADFELLSTFKGLKDGATVWMYLAASGFWRAINVTKVLKNRAVKGKMDGHEIVAAFKAGIFAIQVGDKKKK